MIIPSCPGGCVCKWYQAGIQIVKWQWPYLHKKVELRVKPRLKAYSGFIVYFTLNGTIIYKMSFILCWSRLEIKDWNLKPFRKLMIEVMNQSSILVDPSETCGVASCWPLETLALTSDRLASSICILPFNKSEFNFVCFFTNFHPLQFNLNLLNWLQKKQLLSNYTD